MYIRISDIILDFELSEEINHYLNLCDGNITNEEDMIETCKNTEFYSKNDFIRLPKMNRRLMQDNYIKQLNNREFMHKFRKIPEKDFESFFHWYTTDYHLLDDWRRFVETELRKMAVEWCEQNGIKYTLK